VRRPRNAVSVSRASWIVNRYLATLSVATDRSGNITSQQPPISPPTEARPKGKPDTGIGLGKSTDGTCIIKGRPRPSELTDALSLLPHRTKAAVALQLADTARTGIRLRGITTILPHMLSSDSWFTVDARTLREST
jgi:hypothetical protein